MRFDDMANDLGVRGTKACEPLVVDVLDVALDVISEVICAGLKLDNCIAVLETAETIGCAEVRESAVEYITSNASDVVEKNKALLTEKFGPQAVTIMGYLTR